MKKLVCLILCLIFILAAGCTSNSATGESTVPVETTVPAPTENPDALLKNGKPLKLLAITSSFGLNTTEYLYDIATAEGHTEVIIGRLYIGASTLKKHVSMAQSNAAGYTYYKKEAAGDWVIKEKATMLEGIQDEDWDIIFLQQSAAESGLVDTYGDYITTLIDHVNQHKTNPDAKFIWNMTWAYQSDSLQPVFIGDFKSDQMFMYQSIVKAVNEKVVPRNDIAAIIPTGTAIQNMRTSYFGDNFTQDTYHLNVYGSTVAGYTLYATLRGAPLQQISLTEVTSLVKLTDYAKSAILESVNAAIVTPFSVTPSTYTGK
jgi:hypothetical protein